MKMASIPKPGRDGDAVYYKGRCGNIKRKHTEPYDPRTPDQVVTRSNFTVVSKRWHGLTSEQNKAWRTTAANEDLITESGERVHVNCYHLFMCLNTRRADLGLPQFDFPPAKPVFPSNPVEELVITESGGKFALKLRVSRLLAQYTLVCGPAPKRSGIRIVQHFPFLGLLPPAEDGWSDITELYLARYRVPEFNEAIWIRTCQHIDGWIDMPRVFCARPSTPAS